MYSMKGVVPETIPSDQFIPALTSCRVCSETPPGVREREVVCLYDQLDTGSTHDRSSCLFGLPRSILS